MELRYSEEEVESLYGLYKKIKKETEILGLVLAGPDYRQIEDFFPGLLYDEESHDNIDARLSARQIQESMVAFRTRVEKLEPLMARFRKRLDDKDPITDKPRYGSQAKARVERVLSRYSTIADAAVEVNPSLVEELVRQEIQRAEEDAARQRQAQLDATAAKAALELERQATADAARVERERNDAAEKAAQVEAVQRLAREAAAADRAWVRSIPRTLDSVRTHVQTFRQTEGSMLALKTIFSQILSHPEDESCRRIRRDHPKFLADIGDHEGGKEILIAGGFDLGLIEEVPSFVCKEPNVETDLDGWSEWYDRIKGTLQIIEEEMKKK